MGSQWQGMGTDLMRIPIFADAINKCDVILKPRGVDIKNILTSQNPKLFDNILNSFVGIAAVQVCILVDPNTFVEEVSIFIFFRLD